MSVLFVVTFICQHSVCAPTIPYLVVFVRSTQVTPLLYIFLRYVDRLRDSLRQKLGLAEKMMLREKEMSATRLEAMQEEKDLGPQLDVLRKQTKVLKQQVMSLIIICYCNVGLHYHCLASSDKYIILLFYCLITLFVFCYFVFNVI